ncbi:hypothetical protein ElyMa_000741900 [Elysia marginata]|uniref:Uncharacterized protein n=1 Tax=Elysia marginata TaxID=1093978 RepID=A0AAV4GSA9_9GAST|nr:hypothetical protein ElyMa_000741900 [Elysia marginata]
MLVILQRLIVPDDFKLGICLVIVQVECTHLCLARVGIQRVYSVIVGQAAQSICQSGLDCVERCRLGSKAEIIGIDEPACAVKLWLIICVNVKQCRC